MKKEFSDRSLEEVADFLKTRPYIRHVEVNPEAILNFGPNQVISDFVVDSLISVRTVVESNLGWSCVPEALVLNSLRRKLILEVQVSPVTNSDICIWWLRSRKEMERTAMSLSRWIKDWTKKAD